MRLIETTEKQQHAGQAGYAVTTTSGGALLLEAVVPQLAVVLLSLPSQIGQMEVCGLCKMRPVTPPCDVGDTL